MNAMTDLVLSRPHTHAGKAYGSGDRIDVDAPTADWLIAHGIAVPPAPLNPSATPATESISAPLPEPKPLQRKEPKP